MSTPTTPPRTWATDTNYATGPRSGSATKKIVSDAVAAQGLVAGLTVPVDQVNHVQNNHGDWLATLRNAVLRAGVHNMSIVVARAGGDALLATAVGHDTNDIPMIVTAGEADVTDSLIVYAYHVSDWTESANVGNDDKLTICYDAAAGTYHWIAAGTYQTTELVIGTNDPTGSWTARDTTADRECAAIVSDGAGLFVFVGRKTDVAEAWTASSAGGAALAHNIEATVERFYGVAYGASLFVAVGEAAADAEIWTSADGDAWTQRTNPGTEGLRGVAWNGRKFVALGSAGQVLSSVDGITWAIESGAGVGVPTCAAIAADPDLGTIIAIGTAAQGLVVSLDDGATFATAAAHLTVGGAAFKGLDFSGGRFWLACAAGKIAYSLRLEG